MNDATGSQETMDQEQRAQLGQLVKRRRKQQRISQELLAEKAEVSRRTIYSLEKGQVQTSRDVVERVIRELGFSADEWRTITELTGYEPPVRPASQPLDDELCAGMCAVLSAVLSTARTEAERIALRRAWRDYIERLNPSHIHRFTAEFKRAIEQNDLKGATEAAFILGHLYSYRLDITTARRYANACLTLLSKRDTTTGNDVSTGRYAFIVAPMPALLDEGQVRKWFHQLSPEAQPTLDDALALVSDTA
jgi:transcriptional regulator with XRE-family HTH domain